MARFGEITFGRTVRTYLSPEKISADTAEPFVGLPYFLLLAKAAFTIAEHFLYGKSDPGFQQKQPDCI